MVIIGRYGTFLGDISLELLLAEKKTMIIIIEYFVPKEEIDVRGKFQRHNTRL